MYEEMIGNIFKIKKGNIAHCITADYTLGAGIALELDNEYQLKQELLNNGRNIYPDCIVIEKKDLTIFNLVTKKNRYSKVNYDDLRKSLELMKDYMVLNNISQVYIPQLGCGKDKLDWKQVKSILRDIFKKEKSVNISVLLYLN